jgi:hypothetical protein
MSDDLDCELLCLPDLETGLTLDVTGRQGILTPPRHMALPLMYPEARPCLTHSLICISNRTYEIYDWSLLMYVIIRVNVAFLCVHLV